MAAAAVVLALLAEPAVRMSLQSPSAQDGAAALSMSMRPRPEPITWDIPIHRTPGVEHWIRVYTHEGRPHFETWLQRMSRYEDLVRAHLRSRGLPEDLVYVALIESGFRPLALSPARATGMWQFMEGTAREQGLLVNEYVDERLDPIRSTEAAVEFLAQLHERFGSWYLATAAYNAGPNLVQRVLEEHGEAGEGGEEVFWRISDHLPRETQRHIPRLIAAAVVGKDPGRFGFEPGSRRPISFEVVFAPGGTRLTNVAAAAAVSVEDVRTLNSHLIRDVTPPGVMYPVRIPEGSASRVLAGLSSPAPSPGVMAVADE